MRQQATIAHLLAHYRAGLLGKLGKRKEHTYTVEENGQQVTKKGYHYV